jgi:hypothetical protein
MTKLALAAYRLLMFRSPLDFLTSGSVNGMKEGTLRLGY